jgi:uncharacterized delta-60 repeat protein
VYPGSGFVLARYKRDGGLDLTFDGDGKVVTDLGERDEIGSDVVIQPDGKIVAVGTRVGDPNTVGIVGDFAVVRYNPDGSLDGSFGSAGIVLTGLGAEALAVLLQDDGRIVVVGGSFISGESYDVVLVRYMPDGSLDTSFGGDGIVIADLAPGANDGALDAVLQTDGKIVVAGLLDFLPGPERAFDFLLARFQPDGSLDTQPLDPYLDAPFGVGGVVTTDFGGEDGDYAYAVAIEPGGKFVAAGERRHETAENYSDSVLARYNLDGSLDQMFGAGGKVTTDLSDAGEAIDDIAFQSDGAIVAVGGGEIDGVRQFVVLRYLAARCCGVPGGISSP